MNFHLSKASDCIEVFSCWPCVRHTVQSDGCLVAVVLSNRFLSPVSYVTTKLSQLDAALQWEYGPEAHVSEHEACCADSSGARGASFAGGTALQAGRTRVWFLKLSLEFFIDLILPAALWYWVRLNL